MIPLNITGGAAASARMHTVLDSSGTRYKKKKNIKRKKKLPKVNSYMSSYHIDNTSLDTK